MSNRLASRLGGVTLAALVALGATPAQAAEAAWSEMIGIFSEICLQKFPDDAAVRHFAVEKRLPVMPDEAVHQLLGNDPGQGWFQDTPRGRYLLTIEMPPFHACAIRRTDSAAADFLPPFSLLLGLWASTQSGASLKSLPPQNAQVGGFPSQIYQWVVDRGPSRPPETVMVFVTNATNKVSVRMVRQIKVQ